jgi:hypothetical protein
MTRFLLIFILLLGVSISYAQNSSVYSRYGIGDLEYGYSSRMLGIGDLGVSELDPDHILISNPASWASLNRTRIEFGLGYKGVSISNSSNSAFTSEVEFTGLTFGFPVSRDYGIGAVAGLIPYSNLSYNVKSYTNESGEIPSYSDTYEGKGGLSKIFLGTSIQLPLNVLFGVSADYYFGNLNYFFTREFTSNDDFINSVFENSQRLTGGGATLGLISPNIASDLKLGVFSDLRLGFSVSIMSKLDTDTLYTSTSNFLVDTIASGKVETEIPLRINSGISFTISDQYNVNLDYMFQDFSKYKFNGVSSNHLKEANKFSAAFEYKPKRNLGQTSFDQIVWRAGFSYEQTQYFFNGNDINKFSAFGGLSFPMGPDNTIDLAIEYSNRGSKENNLINEQAIKIYLGLSFGELWFLQFDK